MDMVEQHDRKFILPETNFISLNPKNQLIQHSDSDLLVFFLLHPVNISLAKKKKKTIFFLLLRTTHSPPPFIIIIISSHISLRVFSQRERDGSGDTNQRNPLLTRQTHRSEKKPSPPIPRLKAQTFLLQAKNSTRLVSLLQESSIL